MIGIDLELGISKFGERGLDGSELKDERGTKNPSNTPNNFRIQVNTGGTTRDLMMLHTLSFFEIAPPSSHKTQVFAHKIWHAFDRSPRWKANRQ